MSLELIWKRRGLNESVIFVGKATYCIDHDGYTGGGEFLLTEELLKELEMLDIRSQEIIDRVSNMGFPDNDGSFWV